jgi:hypothetical protein
MILRRRAPATPISPPTIRSVTRNALVDAGFTGVHGRRSVTA